MLSLLPLVLEEEEDEEEDTQQQARGAKSLLVEVVRRAAYDWVLYQGDSRPALRSLAEEARTWLFDESLEENGGQDGLVMSFLGICDSLGLDPQNIRMGIRELTPHHIRTLGRIPINRKKSGGQDNLFGEDVSMVMDFPAELRAVLDEESCGDDDSKEEW